MNQTCNFSIGSTSCPLFFLYAINNKTNYPIHHRYPRPAVPSSQGCCFPFLRQLDAFRVLWMICSCRVMVDDRCHRVWLQRWILSLHIQYSIHKQTCISIHMQKLMYSIVLVTIGLLQKLVFCKLLKAAVADATLSYTIKACSRISLAFLVTMSKIVPCVINSAYKEALSSIE